MHDLNVSVLVPACHNADMLIVGVKGEVSNLRILPADRRTVAMLRSRSSAVSDDVAAARGIVKKPIDE